MAGERPPPSIFSTLSGYPLDRNEALSGALIPEVGVYNVGFPGKEPIFRGVIRPLLLLRFQSPGTPGSPAYHETQRNRFPANWTTAAQIVESGRNIAPAPLFKRNVHHSPHSAHGRFTIQKSSGGRREKRRLNLFHHALL
jgi:hypothetical protein